MGRPDDLSTAPICTFPIPGQSISRGRCGLVPFPLLLRTCNLRPRMSQCLPTLNASRVEVTECFHRTWHRMIALRQISARLEWPKSLVFGGNRSDCK